MSVLLVMLFTVNVFGEQHASKFGEKEKVAVVYENNVFLTMHWGVLLIPFSQVHLVAMPTIWDNKVPIWVVPTELPNFTNPFLDAIRK
mgnify:CR=1 FL=1